MSENRRRSTGTDRGESAVDEHGDGAEQAGASETVSLDELSERSGVSPRTIRYYQTQKLLQRPLKDPSDGRVARYGEEHVERLRVIGELHDRGLKLPAIRELLDSNDAPAQIADWLGLNASFSGSWGEAQPELLSEDDLGDLLAGTPAGTRGILEEAKLIRRQGSSWLVPAPDLCKLTAELIRDGIDADLALRAGDILQSHLRRASADLMSLFEEAIRSGFGAGDDPGRLLRPLRPIAGDAARVIFALELERAISDLLANPKRLARG